MSDDVEKKFSQADVDRIVRERLGRERTEYADYDEIKAENADLKANLAEHESKTLDTLNAKIAAPPPPDLATGITKILPSPGRQVLAAVTIVAGPWR